MPFDFELAMRVRSEGGPPDWAEKLLLTLARYQLRAREIRPGESWALGPLAPGTALDTVLITRGPTLSTADEPISVRNAVGLHPGERGWLERVQSAAFIDDLLTKVDPTLTVTLDRPCLSDDAAFVARMSAASAAAGTDTDKIELAGIRWRPIRDGFEVHVPKGHGARLKRVLEARLPFGRQLFVHSEAMGAGTEVIFAPGPSLAADVDDGALIVDVPDAAPFVAALTDEPVAWKLPSR